MLRIVLALLLVVGCCCSLSASEHPSQPDTLVITQEMLAKGVSFDSLLVRFHAGDDIRWKEWDFDDSAWQVVRNDTAGRLLPSGIGWFRVYVRISTSDSTIIARVWSYVPFAAQEIFLNGKLIYSAGTVSSISNNEIFAELPPKRKSISFPTDGVYSMAFRISTWNRPQYKSILGWHYQFVQEFDIGLQFFLKSENMALIEELREKQTNMIYTVSTVVLIVMAVFLGYLYFLDRREQIAMLFAFYCVTTILWMIEFRIEGYTTVSCSQSFIGYILNYCLGIISQTTLLVCSRVYLDGKLHSRAIIIGAALMLLGLVLFAIAPYDATRYLIIFVDCITICTVVVIILRKNGEQNDRFIVIGIGFTALLDTLFHLHHWIIELDWVVNDGTRLLSFTILPLAIIIILVRRTAQDRQRLARYSQDLERDVADRTRDLQTANEEISRQMEVQAEQAREIEQAHHESESLLLNILPAPIAHRLKSGERAIADKFDSVTVLFADIVGFTKLSARATPEALVEGLNAIFGRFDALAKEYGLEKIKTIGDAYMVAGGLPERSGDHCERVAMFALEMQAAMREESLRTSTGVRVELRIGIHTGEAVAGVIGTSKFAYDLWGDTVNTASRMESHGEAGRIHVSEEVYVALKEKFVFEERGEIEVKGKGVMRTWFLLSRMTGW